MESLVEGAPVTFRELIELVVSSLDYDSALEAVAGLAVPDFGSWSIVDVAETPESIRRVAVIHPDPEKRELVRDLPSGWPPETTDPIGAPAVMRTREPHVVRNVTDEMLAEFARSPENLAVLRELGIGSYLVLPLVAQEEVIGAVTYVSVESGYEYTEDDLREAEELASLIALVVHNARLHRDMRRARDRASRRAEEAERQRRDLERLMELHARLVRGFSHDVKNPLGAAMGYAELLESGVRGPMPERQMASVRQIGSSIRAALALIDDLVQYASGKMGRLEVRLDSTDVRRIVEDIADEYRAQAEAAGLQLELEIPGELPEVQSDRIRIRQILGNLLSNAVKYTEEGRITLRATAGRAPARGDDEGGHPEGGASTTLPPDEEAVIVQVTDTGTGIPPEQQEHLFKEFARLDPTSSTGAGLGLAISRSIADALGAELTVRSEVDEGSTFSLRLPLRGRR